MKTKLTLTLLALAAVSLNLHAATSALPAPLPEFMDDAQAAKWTADQAAAAQTTSAQEPSTQFYTGKPYVADAGGYIYKYRTYNPEISRWTSADPSGFPDGPNNERYTPVPTGELDSNGLITITGLTAPNLSTLPVSYDGTNYTVQSISGAITPISASSFSASFPGYTFTTGSSPVQISVNASTVFDSGSGSGGETLSLTVTNEYYNLPPSVL